MDCLPFHHDHRGGTEADRNGMIRMCEQEKNRGIGEKNLIRVTELECLKMLTTLSLLPFREVLFARNEESILEKGSKRRSSGRYILFIHSSLCFHS